jgi:hypothetical protein
LNASESITTEILDAGRRKEWDAYADNNEVAIAWHLWEWHDVLKRHYPHDFYPLAAVKENRVCGLFPIYRLHEKAHRNSFISIPFVVAGGIISDGPEIDKILLESAIRLAKQEHVDSIVMKQYNHRIDGDLRIDDTFFNRELSLAQGLDSIWGNLAPENRSMISSAKNEGFRLEFPSKDSGAFYSLLLAHHHRQGIPCVSRKWVEDLIASSMYELALVYYKNKPLTGTMLKIFRKTVSFPLTAVPDTAERSHKSVYWLYWQLISHFTEKKFEIIHSGRIPIDESVPRFRLGWGGEKKPYFYEYYPNVNRMTEFSLKRGIKRRLFSRFWRLLPKVVAAQLGPSIVRKFP